MEFHGRKRVQRPQKYNPGGNSLGGRTPTGDRSPELESDQVVLTQGVTVKDLAAKLGMPDTAVMQHIFTNMGRMCLVKELLDLEDAKQVALDLGYEVLDSKPQSKGG